MSNILWRRLTFTALLGKLGTLLVLSVASALGADDSTQDGITDGRLNGKVDINSRTSGDRGGERQRRIEESGVNEVGNGERSVGEIRNNGKRSVGEIGEKGKRSVGEIRDKRNNRISDIREKRNNRVSDIRKGTPDVRKSRVQETGKDVRKVVNVNFIAVVVIMIMIMIMIMMMIIVMVMSGSDNGSRDACRAAWDRDSRDREGGRCDTWNRDTGNRKGG
jgi:hypothetical protein